MKFLKPMKMRAEFEDLTVWVVRQQPSSDPEIDGVCDVTTFRSESAAWVYYLNGVSMAEAE